MRHLLMVLVVAVGQLSAEKPQPSITDFQELGWTQFKAKEKVQAEKAYLDRSAQEEIDKANFTGVAPSPELHLNRCKLGDIGRVLQLETKTVEYKDSATGEKRPLVVTEPVQAKLKIVKIVDQVLVCTCVDKKIALVSPDDTSGLVDGDEIKPSGIWFIAATFKDSGSTMPVAVRWKHNDEYAKVCKAAEDEAYAREEKQIRDEQESAAKAKSEMEARKWRKWTGSDGKEFEAKYAGINSGKVKLIKKNGGELKVPLESLSKEERAWIKTKAWVKPPASSPSKPQ